MVGSFSLRRPAPSALLNSGHRYLLSLIWIAFLMRGLFYAALLPLWEGYDEWCHFAYVQRMAGGGELPIASQSRITREVQESLRLVPLAWTLRDW